MVLNGIEFFFIYFFKYNFVVVRNLEQNFKYIKILVFLSSNYQAKYLKDW